MKSGSFWIPWIVFARFFFQIALNNFVRIHSFHFIFFEIRGFGLSFIVNRIAVLHAQCFASSSAFGWVYRALRAIFGSLISFFWAVSDGWCPAGTLFESKFGVVLSFGYGAFGTGADVASFDQNLDSFSLLLGLKVNFVMILDFRLGWTFFTKIKLWKSKKAYIYQYNLSCLFVFNSNLVHSVGIYFYFPTFIFSRSLFEFNDLRIFVKYVSKDNLQGPLFLPFFGQMTVSLSPVALNHFAVPSLSNLALTPHSPQFCLKLTFLWNPKFASPHININIFGFNISHTAYRAARVYSKIHVRKHVKMIIFFQISRVHFNFDFFFKIEDSSVVWKFFSGQKIQRRLGVVARRWYLCLDTGRLDFFWNLVFLFWKFGI